MLGGDTDIWQVFHSFSLNGVHLCFYFTFFFLSSVLWWDVESGIEENYLAVEAENGGGCDDF